MMKPVTKQHQHAEVRSQRVTGKAKETTEQKLDRLIAYVKELAKQFNELEEWVKELQS